MGKSFAPAAALMGRLKYAQRFGLITLVFFIPIALLLFSFPSEIVRQSDFSQKDSQTKRYGVLYLRPLMELYRHTNQEHLLGLVAARGIATSGPELLANQAQIDLDLEALMRAHHHDGIIITDERGVVKVLNGAATQMLFTTFDVAVGRSLMELVRDPKMQELLRAALLTPGPVPGDRPQHQQSHSPDGS